MKIILHIGMNKTGTTALQNCMFTNRKRLLEHGVLWPDTGRQGAAHYQLAGWLGFNHIKGWADRSALAIARSTLWDEIEKSGASTVIISSEYFVLNRPMDFVRSFFDGFDVEVVAVLRRHDTWWPSLWVQAIPTVANPPWARSFESFQAFQLKAKDQHLSFRALLETWETVFPGAVRAIAYERAQMPQGVVPAFLAAVGMGALVSVLEGVDGRHNASSLRMDVLSLVDLLQRRRQTPDDNQALAIRRALACSGQGPLAEDFLSGRLKRQLVLSQGADYAFLDKMFGRNGKGFFQDPIAEDDGRDGPHVLPYVNRLTQELVG